MVKEDKTKIGSTDITTDYKKRDISRFITSISYLKPRNNILSTNYQVYSRNIILDSKKYYIFFTFYIYSQWRYNNIIT